MFTSLKRFSLYGAQLSPYNLRSSSMASPTPSFFNQLQTHNDAQAIFVAAFRSYEQAGPRVYFGAALLEAIRQEFTVYTFTDSDLLSDYEIYKRVHGFLVDREVNVPTHVKGNNIILVRILWTIWNEEEDRRDLGLAYELYLDSRQRRNNPSPSLPAPSPFQPRDISLNTAPEPLPRPTSDTPVPSDAQGTPDQLQLSVLKRPVETDYGTTADQTGTASDPPRLAPHVQALPVSNNPARTTIELSVATSLLEPYQKTIEQMTALLAQTTASQHPNNTGQGQSSNPGQYGHEFNEAANISTTLQARYKSEKQKFSGTG